MKRVASRPNPESHQSLGEASKDGRQTQNHCGELIEMRFLLTERLSIRCECYLSANAWLHLKDSPELRSIARKAIERIISERCSGLGGDDDGIH